MAEPETPEPVERDEAWVAERFGDVGPPPDNEVQPDKAADVQPQPTPGGLEHPR